jgi:hypothetical protein
VHLIKQNPVPVDTRPQTIINRNFREILRLHRKGVKIVFPDITRLEKRMTDELNAGADGVCIAPIGCLKLCRKIKATSENLCRVLRRSFSRRSLLAEPADTNGYYPYRAQATEPAA